MKAVYDDVVASYHRCRQSGRFFDTFYDVFLGKSPEIAAKFVRTDFARQKLMLKQSLLEMLNHYCGVESVRPEIERLGGYHRQLAVRPEHYDFWLSPAAMQFGVEQHPVAGVTVRVFSAAKTVVDCFKYRNKIGLDVAIEALRDRLRRRKATVDELWTAAVFGCRHMTGKKPTNLAASVRQRLFDRANRRTSRG